MNQAGYIALTIVIIVVLAIIAVVSFILYKKTPAPKGCENLEPDEGLCCACLKSGCPFYAQYHDKKAEAASASAAPSAPSAPKAPQAPSPSEDKGEKK